MPAPYCYDHPRPALTVDLVVFAHVDDSLLVLLVRRKHDPFAGRWAIPGGFLDMDETAEAGARRECLEETGIDLTGVAVDFLAVFDAPGRDPRGRTISLAHVAVMHGAPPNPRGGDDAAEAAWVAVNEAHDLAFDHDKILRTARSRLAEKLLDGNERALALLPERFGAEAVRRLFQGLGLAPHTADPWLDRMASTPVLETIDGTPTQYQRRNLGAGRS